MSDKSKDIKKLIYYKYFLTLFSNLNISLSTICIARRFRNSPENSN